MEHFETPDVGLRAIVAYKLTKALGQALATLVLVRELLLGRVDSLAGRLAAWFGRQDFLHSLGEAIAEFLHAELTHAHLVLGIALLGADACLTATEGLGLHFRQRWAAWLVVVATSGLLPLEVWGLAHKLSPGRVAILLVNASIVAYMALRVLHHHRRQDERASTAGATSGRFVNGSR